MHEAEAQHGHGVTTETSQVDPASQHTVDEAERPGAESSAPTAHHPEPAPASEHYERVHEEPRDAAPVAAPEPAAEPQAAVEAPAAETPAAESPAADPERGAE